MSSPPTGTVTFLFTDIEGSTRLAQAHPSQWEATRQRHHAILRAASEAHQGYVFQVIGDAFCVAFPTVLDALVAALEAQRALQAADWGQPPIRVRMGLHTGAAEAYAGEYRGYLTLAHVQRVMSAAFGGQTLVSNAAAVLLSEQPGEGTTLRDMGEHRLNGLLNPEHLWQLAAPGLLADFPALRSLNTIPNNLPIQVTSFIGRERELSELQKLLSDTRLLTLTGSGGTGKTRLSLQLSAGMLDRFPDGAWFVEFAPLADAALVPQSVATVLGVREEPGRPLLAALMDWLRPRQLLLILDNCEHLIEACAKLADALLHAGHGVQILASSREALGIAGETAYRVPSLECPAAALAIQSSIEQLTQYAAVQLFVERATQALPSFTLTNTNASAVAQICYRLDGIPLAIELAAARVKALSAEKIAERLDDRFRLLTGGSRTALPRQQTLRSLIDWSHSLLSEPERILLRRLSVFAGGWTLEAAEDICAGDGLESFAILDALTHLVDKSLVVLDEQSDDLRYRLLETIRQYARDKLLESDEAEPVRARHLAFYFQLAETAEPMLRSVEQSVWWNRLDKELDNLRAAIEWSLHSRDVAPGAAIVSALWMFWFSRGYLAEALTLLREILARPELTQHSRLRALTLNTNGFMHFWIPNGWVLARPMLAEALLIGRELEDDWVIAIATIFIVLTLDENHFASAEQLAAQNLARLRKSGDTWLIAFSLLTMGDIALAQGNHAKAQTLYQESARLFRAVREKNLLANPVRRLGYLALKRNQLDEATDLFTESLALNLEIEERVGIGACLAAFAALAMVRGQAVRAAHLFGAAKTLIEYIGAVMPLHDQSEHDCNLRALRTQLDDTGFNAAWDQGRAMTMDQAIKLAVDLDK